MANPAQKASANSAMEQFLLSWLEQLEERLGEVTTAIDVVETRRGLEVPHPEEAMFELLRAAG